MSVPNSVSDLYNQAIAAYKSGDFNTALKLFKLFAQTGFDAAQYNLAIMYANGKGTDIDMAASLYWMEQAANQGNADAQLITGFWYEEGHGTAPDEEKALYWYERAAEQGNADAQYHCGLVCLKRDRPQRTERKAMEWFEKAAKSGHSKAKLQLGKIHLQGNIVPIDYDAAYSLFMEAKEDPDTHDLAECYLAVLKIERTVLSSYQTNRKNNNMHDAFADLEDCLLLYFDTEKGSYPSPHFYYRLARCYYWANGVNRDVKKAIELYRFAAERGYPKAKFDYAMLYFEGEHVPRDLEIAGHWFERARLCGDSRAEGMLRLVDQGKYDDLYDNAMACVKLKDYKTAQGWFLKAIKMGHTRSMVEYGNKFRWGTGVDQDFGKAMEYFEMAAQLGNAGGYYHAAFMYSNGQGVERDPEKAIAYFREAERISGDDHSFFIKNIQSQDVYDQAMALYKEKDFKGSFPLFVQAAELGGKEAMFQCGKMCEQGKGTKKDQKLALQWYESAGDAGHGEACYRAARIHTAESRVLAAYEWDLKGANLGNKYAQFSCGIHFLHAKAPARNVNKAKEWLEKSAKQGYRDAQYMLGMMYDMGDICCENNSIRKKEAKYWFEKAAKNGHDEAKNMLKKLRYRF